MKKVIAIAALAVLAGSAHAQLYPVPPTSDNDGIFIQTPTVNLDGSHWGSATSLAAYQFNTTTNLQTPNTGNPDNRLGLHWGSSVSAGMSSIMDEINTDGGSIRIIYLGKSAGWWNDLGYTYSGDPTDSTSFSIWRDIPYGNPTPANFGDYVDIPLFAGEISSFDIWLSGSESTSSTDYPSSYRGGYYTAFNQSNSNPYLAPGNAKLTQDALLVNTYVEALHQNFLASTYLLGFEDIRLSSNPDKDYNDVMVALQFFRSDGTPFTPVPEPSTYGLIGGIALLGLVLRRRFAKK